MPLYTDTTSNTVHEYDPETFGVKLLANLVACGVLAEGDQTGEAKPRARKAAAKAEPPADTSDTED
jgi:hypothetical protein